MNRTLVAAILLVVAAVTGVAGSFLELVLVRYKFPGGNETHSYNCWEYLNDQVFPTHIHPPRYGFPIVAAAAVLVVAAVFLLRGRESGRVLAVGGGAGLVAAVWAAVEAYLSAVSQVGEEPVEFRVEVDRGDGLVMLIASVVVAAVGLVLLWRRAKKEEQTGVVIHQFDDTDEMDTPPYGIPVQQENA